MRRLALAACAWCACAGAHAANVAPGGYAWSENAGWINFAPASGPGVTVSDTLVTGFAWSENLGWINLSPTSGGVLNSGSGVLSGYAWSENAGWLGFAPIGTPGVRISAMTGRFSGYAWGENIGWVNFDTQAAVTTTWRPVDALFADGFE